MAQVQGKPLVTRQVKPGSQRSTERRKGMPGTAHLTGKRVMDSPRLRLRSRKVTPHRAAIRRGRGIKVLLGDTLRPVVMHRQAGTRRPVAMVRLVDTARLAAIHHPEVTVVRRDSG